MLKHRKGFSLVELSIVLVILGLLVGGVLSGKSLIRSAELRSVISDKNRYTTAINGFRGKYFALPGDMPNAFAFWGATCGTDTTDASVGCNGNGNGLIQNQGLAGEATKVWEHLNRAGLIEGNFDGTGVLSVGSIILDANNIPKSKLTDALWNVGDNPCEGCGGGTPDMRFDHVLLTLGSLHPTADPGTLFQATNLSNSEAWNIDMKIDDGRSTTGNMRGTNANGYCEDTGTDSYALSTYADTKDQCAPTFKLY